MMPHNIDWSKIEWQTVRRGIERKAFTGDGATVALHRLWPGHEPRPHAHPNEQIVYIMDGTVDFHVGDDVIRLGAGGLCVVPPNVQHYAEVVGDKPVLNLDIFTPARPDYVAA
jgi:quercetin dioxygenase-like cupin family protein